MDGRGRWRDNAIVFHAYVDGREAIAGIGRYVEMYNSRRPHSSLEGQTPDTAYFNQLPELQAA